jgi:hypothetical protein
MTLKVDEKADALYLRLDDSRIIDKCNRQLQREHLHFGLLRCRCAQGSLQFGFVLV